MDSVQRVQHLQLALIESASVCEICAIDLAGILYKLTDTEAEGVLGIIEQLLRETETLRGLSISVTANQLFVQSR